MYNNKMSLVSIVLKFVAITYLFAGSIKCDEGIAHSRPKRVPFYTGTGLGVSLPSEGKYKSVRSLCTKWLLCYSTSLPLLSPSHSENVMPLQPLISRYILL